MVIPFRLLSLLAALTVASLGIAACGDDTVAGDGSDGPTRPADDDGGSDNDSRPPLGGGPYPIADLTINYSHDDGTSYSYRVTCLGDTATLAGDAGDLIASSACLGLADPDVQTRLIKGAPLGRNCTHIYGGSDEAHVTGKIDDLAVDTIIDRSGGCGIWDWDNLLPAILPTPIGI
jgi:hypothetical protein